MICKGSRVHIPSAVNHLQQSSGDRGKNKSTIGGSHLVLPFELAPDVSVWIKENDDVGASGTEVFHSKCKAHMLSEVNPRSAKVGLKALVRPWVCTFYYFANVTREEETAVHQEPPDGQCHLWDIRVKKQQGWIKRTPRVYRWRWKSSR